MSLPKIAEALQRRKIAPNKMWFNPLAPAPAPAPAQPVTDKPVSEPEKPASKGAPVKEAEALVPKREVPKVVPPPPIQEPPLSQNL
jgi:hypothetical protein